MRAVNLGLAIILGLLAIKLLSTADWDQTGPDSGAANSYELSDTTANGAEAPNRLRHYAAEDGDRAAQRGAAALAEITYPWQERLPGWEIHFLTAEEGAYGHTLTQEQRIDIFVRENQSHELLAHVVAHEIGHAVDVTLNNGEDRDRWQELRHIQDAPWWPDNRAADFATGAGDFAESFAAWQVGADSFRSELAEPPGRTEEALLAELAAG